MVNYNNGKIYKIEPICNHDEGEIYIGSTTKQYLSQRLDTHRSKYKQWKNGKYSKVRVFEIFDKYCVSNCQIVLIENVNAKSKDELLAREKYYIQTLTCVNKAIPIKSFQEVKENRKNYKRLYYEQNKEKIKEKKNKYKTTLKTNNHIVKQKPLYVSTNQEIDNSKVLHICECGGQYTQANRCVHFKTIIHQNFINNVPLIVKDKKEEVRLYRERNKERLSVKTNCACGGCYRLHDKCKHFKTIKHQEYLKSQIIDV